MYVFSTPNFGFDLFLIHHLVKIMGSVLTIGLINKETTNNLHHSSFLYDLPFAFELVL